MTILAAAVVAHPYTAATIDQLADVLAATDGLTAWLLAADGRRAATDQAAQQRLSTLPDDPVLPHQAAWTWKTFLGTVPRPLTADQAAAIWADPWESLSLVGPAGLRLYVEPHCAVYWDARWNAVLTHPPSQQGFQRAYRGLATALESPGVLIRTVPIRSPRS